MDGSQHPLHVSEDEIDAEFAIYPGSCGASF